MDWVAGREDTPRTRALLERLGYSANRRFNNLQRARRLLYYDEANGRQLDVFVGAFRMCHELELAGRLELAPETLTPADLLLSKLQVVEINRKDLVDAITLLHACPVVERMRAGAAELDLERLSDVAGGGWGWVTTLTAQLGGSPPAGGEGRERRGAGLWAQPSERRYPGPRHAARGMS